MIDLRLLISKGVHFGHQTWRWNPKMGIYIWGQKNGVHLIDVSKTAFQLERAAAFLKQIAAEGGEILWVGTKKAAQDTVTRIGTETNSPIVAHRWVGGTATNFTQVKKSVTKLLHLEDIIEKSAGSTHYTKKELSVFNKLVERARKTVGGLRNLTWPIGALVVVDVKKEHVAVREAIDQGIPVVALVDTNSDPSNIAHVIPANDDAPQAITLLLEYLAEAVKEGQVVAAQRAAERAAEAATAREERKAKAVSGAEEKTAIQAQLEAVEAALGQDEPAAGRKVTGGARRGGNNRPQGAGAERRSPQRSTGGASRPAGAGRPPKASTPKPKK